ncbi:MAG: hypothetical protein P4M02_03700, partial [Clostridia bacterium]|nr:hypothetical protein [Clostridia bacterium]
DGDGVLRNIGEQSNVFARHFNGKRPLLTGVSIIISSDFELSTTAAIIWSRLYIAYQSTA